MALVSLSQEIYCHPKGLASQPNYRDYRILGRGMQIDGRRACNFKHVVWEGFTEVTLEKRLGGSKEVKYADS